MRGLPQACRKLAEGIFLCLVALSAVAAPVSLVMPSGITALADFHSGKPDKPAILLLHGFLQTYQFPTVFHLTEGLRGEGYTLLAPTLSLGVPHRKQSLACEAVHTHTLKGDAAEIDAWLNWLRDKGYRSVVLIGHSTGSANLLYYLAHYHHPSVRKMIGISLVEARFELDAKGQAKLAADLRKRIAQGDNTPLTHQLSFCKQFRGSPASLLSYLELSPEQILKTMRSVSVPQAYIMGDHDDRMGRNWLPRLQRTGQPVRIIQGANHFMDGEYEFDLQDAVISELRQPGGTRPP